jgi:cell division protein FtsB
LLALLAAVATLALDQEAGISATAELVRRVEDAEKRVAHLQAERCRLIEEVKGLRSDPLAIESAARQRLRMVRSDEVMVVLNDVRGAD